MNIQEIKQYIYENNYVEKILEELGMHSIKLNDGGRYYSCGMPDGDNKKSTIIYNDKSLGVTAYTRDITDDYGNSDLISLVCFIQNTYFTQSVKWLCDLCGLDYYSNHSQDMPSSLIFLKRLKQMDSYGNCADDEYVKPIDTTILSYFEQHPVQKWIDEGIDYDTQVLFKIGFDLDSTRITIPIYDELGTLVGIKGRIYNNEDSDSKYMYLVNCAKSKILFGLDKALPYIKQQGYVIVVEAEKSVMKLWSMGYRNTVSIGSHTISKTQVNLLTRLCVTVLIAFDKDVKETRLGLTNHHDTTVIEECAKFMPCVSVEYLMDKDNLLGEKESPCDNAETFAVMMKANRYKYIK